MHYKFCLCLIVYIIFVNECLYYYFYYFFFIFFLLLLLLLLLLIKETMGAFDRV